MSHPSQKLDEVVHQKTRLGMLAVLSEVRRADFNFLKSTLGLSDGNLSRHLQVLQEAGLVALEKVFEGRRPRTWVSITDEGRSAFQAELTSLQALMAGLTGAGASTAAPADKAPA
ncbi:MAG TPA: transcriptional regulator [Actinomycetota bacterium]|nr:transcriptional regulator [Actinomycetota bacterium]